MIAVVYSLLPARERVGWLRSLSLLKEVIAGRRNLTAVTIEGFS